MASSRDVAFTGTILYKLCNISNDLATVTNLPFHSLKRKWHLEQQKKGGLFSAEIFLGFFFRCRSYYIGAPAKLNSCHHS